MDEENPVHRAYSLLKDDRFFEEYERRLPDCRTGKECFEQIDEHIFEILGRYRYAEYGSFRVTLHLWRKKKKPVDVGGVGGDRCR